MTADQIPLPPCPAEASTDFHLLTAIAAGDASAFEQIYARHAKTCAGRARRVLASEEWVDDVVQSVFLDTWRHAGRYDSTKGGVRAWLLGMTHHKAVDIVRRQQRHAERRALEDELAGRRSDEPGPEEKAVHADAAERLRAQVLLLPPRQSRAVTLCFFEGLTQEQAAVVLEVPLGTVKTRSHHGLRRLRAALEMNP